MRTANFFAGFLSGVILGAVIVLLTTPQSGSDLQTEVKSRVESIMEEGRKAAAARRAELEDRLANLRTGT